jgi:20S proteasome subunit beta 6
LFWGVSSFIWLCKKLVILQDAVTPLTEAEAIDVVKDVFASATERDIYTVYFCFLFSFCPLN